jgi:tetratricopeptide (TPR) repeat protein
MCVVLPALWFIRSDLDEPARWLERVLALGDDLQPGERAAALSMRGRLGQVLGDNSPRVVRDFEESMAIFRELGDEGGIARSMMSLGNFHRRLGDFDQAEELFRGSLEMYRRLGDSLNEGGALLNLGDLYTARGDAALARATFQEVVTLARGSGNQIGLAYALGYLGSTAYMEGELDEAERHFKESLEIFRALGGGDTSQGWMVGGLGAVERERGNLGLARARFAESLVLFRDRQYRPGIAYALISFASLAAIDGNAERAVLLLGAGEAIEREAWIARTPSEETARRIVVERALPVMGEEAFSRARERGAELTLARALALTDATAS